MIRLTKVFLGALLVVTFFAIQTPYKSTSIPYQLDEPDLIIKLSSELKEISGLTIIDENKLACIQDEEGIVYYLNPQSGKIEAQKRFAGNHDFEGIEYVNNTTYILRSDGVVYEYLGQGEPTVYKSKLSHKYDFEGLGYDAKNNCLLLAAKANPNGKEDRLVFAFDLNQKKFLDKEIFKVDIDDIGKGIKKFAPSAIAIHPITKNRYILASSGKLLVTLDTEGKVIAHKKLNKKLFKQPEGIAFMPDGTLYISNEGRSGKANILRFRYETN